MFNTTVILAVTDDTHFDEANFKIGVLVVLNHYKSIRRSHICTTKVYTQDRIDRYLDDLLTQRLITRRGQMFRITPHGKETMSAYSALCDVLDVQYLTPIAVTSSR